MVRVSDLEQSLDFYCTALGLTEVYRKKLKGRFTLVFLAAPSAMPTNAQRRIAPLIELTYNWDPEGEPSTMGKAATLAIWPTGWIIFTPPVS